MIDLFIGKTAASLLRPYRLETAHDSALNVRSKKEALSIHNQ